MTEPCHVHPSAIIAEDVQLGSGVRVDAFSVIEAGVSIGDDTHVLAGCVIKTGSRIGAGCQLGPYATLATEPFDSNFTGEPSYLVLEDAVRVGQFSSLARATGAEQRTYLGQGVWIGPHCHIAHNCQLEAGVRVIAQSALAGHVEVGHHAFISAGSHVHQFVHIGAYAMVAGMSAVRHDVLPFTLVQGQPLRHYCLNKVGLERQGISGVRYRGLETAFRTLRARKSLAPLAQTNPDAANLQAFIARSKRGISKFLR